MPNVSMIGCFRYGPELLTTVVILLNAAHPPRHLIEKNITQIRERLRRYGLEKVDVKVEKGSLSLGNSAFSVGPLDPQIFEGRAIVGQSLAHASNTDAAGTLGGFVQLKFKGTSAWKTMALTCYHVAADPALTQQMINYWKKNSLAPHGMESAREVLSKWHDYGVLPNDQNHSMLQVDHPATASLTKYKEDLTDDLEVQMASFGLEALLIKDESGEGDCLRRDQMQTLRKGKDLRRRIDQCERFIANGGQKFGIVWAASGFKAEHRGTRGFEWADRNGLHTDKVTLRSKMDWALIIPPKDRIPKIPVSQTFHFSIMTKDTNSA